MRAVQPVPVEAGEELRTEVPIALDPDAAARAAHEAYADGRLEDAVAVWERLHAACVAGGQDVAASQAASMAALLLMIDTGLMAPVRAWRGRAERLLAGHPEGSAHAWIATIRACECLMAGDVEGMARWSAAAIDLGQRHDVLAAVVIGRTELARARILAGDVGAGMAMLDDVGALLLGGDVDPLTTGMMLCELVCAAMGLGLYDRVQEWTDAMDRWGRGVAFGSIGGRCRVHRAEVARIRGPYDVAEREILHACEALRPWMRREFGWPLTELGTIRLRRGDLAGAEEAFMAAYEQTWDPEPGLALLRLAQGDATAAMALITRAIDHPMDIPSKERPPRGALQRAPLLAAQVEIALAVGDQGVAAAAAADLAAIAGRFPTPAIRATAALAEGRAALAAGDLEGAVPACRQAVDRWGDAGAPYEAAMARLLLGRALEAQGEPACAAVERRTGEATLARMGAAHPPPAEGPAPPPARATAPAAEQPAFRCEGDTRRIDFDGRTVVLRDLKGMRYLARLLAEPGREFHVVDLVAVEAGTLPRGRTRDPGAAMGAPGDAGVLLDDAARQAYRRRLADVEVDIDEAEAANDLERAARARLDRDHLVTELARAVGLGGRARRAGDPSERARTAVTRAVRYSLARVAAHHPALAHHLEETVRTGTYCSYRPDPRLPIRWRT